MISVYSSVQSIMSMGPVVLALGFFDGLHIGHQTVIQQALQLAHEGDARMCVITFDIPPRAVLRPEHPVQLLETRQEKIRKLEKMGVDTVVFIHPTVEVLSETAEDFMQSLAGISGLYGIVCGSNFTFGRHAAGSPSTLSAFFSGRGIKVKIVPLTTSSLLGGREVSSTVIRKLIGQGRIRVANQLLGEEYTITGTVAHGFRRGHDVTGVPTVNLETDGNCVIPSDGVYASRILIKGVTHASITNIGTNPTFGNQARTIETFILDFHQEIYEKKVMLSFVERIRGEIKFPSVEALTTQIQQDVEMAEKLLNR